MNAPTLWLAAAMLAAAPIGTLRVDLGSATFRADVLETPDGKLLRIACEIGCASLPPYEEAVGDTLLGLFQLWDGDGLLLSTWTSASAYIVRVHRLSPDGVGRTLEVASRTAPGVSLDARGRLMVETTERTGGPADRVRRVVHVWDGVGFRRSRR